MNETGKNPFAQLLDVVRRLRRECPWDKAQTIGSLVPLLLDECYEVKEAVGRGDYEGMCEEVGDVLALVLMIAEVAREERAFSLNDALRGIVDKLERRHPHVFAGKHVKDAREVVKLWGEIKAAEKGESVLSGIPKGLPALRRAHLIQRRASSVGFDWKDTAGILEKLGEEIGELKGAKSKEEIENELGDVLFILANLGNKLGVDPEEALAKVCEKFVARFSKVEERLRREGKTPGNATLEEMDKIWEEIKRGRVE